MNKNDLDMSEQHGSVICLTIDAPSAHAADESSPSRWRAYHFFLSYLVFLVDFQWMVHVPIEVSSGAWLSALADCFQRGRHLFQ